MMDTAERSYGMVTIIVQAEPIMGYPPNWANAIEIADECIQLVIERNRQEKKQEDELTKSMQ